MNSFSNENRASYWDRLTCFSVGSEFAALEL